MTNYVIKENEIEDLGPAALKRLNENGIVYVHQLATCVAGQLSDLLEIPIEKARLYRTAANKFLDQKGELNFGFKSQGEIKASRKNVEHLSTGSMILDQFFKGGIETRAITEFYGKFGSGKTQLCHTMAVLATQDGITWKNGNVLYIDTEGTYRPERIEEIAKAREIDPDSLDERIFHYRFLGASELELFIGDTNEDSEYEKKFGVYLAEHNIKLVIVDSIIALHRAEFVGRGMLGDRQARLNRIMIKLNRIANMYNIAVVITNQVYETVDAGMFGGDPMRAMGGNVIAHGSTYRVSLRRTGGDRVATFVDSPYHPYTDVKFTVNERGVDDLEEFVGKPKKKATNTSSDSLAE